MTTLATPRRRAPARPENAIQADIVGYLRAVVPNAIVYANANAARRTASGRAANGVPGLLPGIPDLSVCIFGGQILYFEVKAPGGRLSKPQEGVIAMLRAIGARVAVVTSIDEVRAALREWSIETREVVDRGRPKTQAMIDALTAGMPA